MIISRLVEFCSISTECWFMWIKLVFQRGPLASEGRCASSRPRPRYMNGRDALMTLKTELSNGKSSFLCSSPFEQGCQEEMSCHPALPAENEAALYKWLCFCLQKRGHAQRLQKIMGFCNTGGSLFPGRCKLTLKQDPLLEKYSRSKAILNMFLARGAVVYH